MNLALGAIVLAILLIPPLIFLFFYNKGTNAKGIPKLTLLEYFLLSAVLSLFIHGLLIHYYNLQIDYAFLVKFVSGQLSPKDIESYVPLYRQYFVGFSKYLLSLCAIADSRAGLPIHCNCAKDSNVDKTPGFQKRQKAQRLICIFQQLVVFFSRQ